MKIGWIGLGMMGLEMAKNLYKTGQDITVWNRTIQKAIESKLPYKENLKELVEKSDIIVTMLSDSESVLEIYNQIIRLNIENKIFIDMTTVHPDTAKKISEILIPKKAEFLEAPVIGSVIPARKGNLTILVSGDKETLEKVSIIFKILGKDIFYLSEYGKASTAKLINNVVLASFMNVLSDAIVFGEKAGLNKELFIKILESGAGKSAVLEAKKEKILNKDYSSHFSVDLLFKDLKYACDVADKYKVPFIYGSEAKNLFSSAKANGYGQKDFSIIIEIFKKLSGIEL